MTLAEHYATLAVRFRAKARNERMRKLKAEWKRLAECYAQLADGSQLVDDSQHPVSQWDLSHE
jgi:hypothetical protein